MDCSDNCSDDCSEVGTSELWARLSGTEGIVPPTALVVYPNWGVVP
jgi:hypothetical protein